MIVGLCVGRRRVCRREPVNAKIQNSHMRALASSPSHTIRLSLSHVYTALRGFASGFESVAALDWDPGDEAQRPSLKLHQGCEAWQQDRLRRVSGGEEECTSRCM